MTRNEEEERRMAKHMVELLVSMAGSLAQIANILEVLMNDLEDKKGEKK